MGSEGYYLLTVVFHDQGEDVRQYFDRYEQDLSAKGLPDIPMHASPLLNGHGDYEDIDPKTRKRLLMSFLFMARRLPIRFHTFSYRKSEYPDPVALEGRIKRDLVNLLFDHLAYFQSFESVKIYYDGARHEVTQALRAAVSYALSKEAIVYRDANYRDFRLFQVADLLCTLELTGIKYENHAETATDRRAFGDARSFNRNFMRKFDKLRV